MGVKAVIFDLDGTVVQYRINLEEGRREMAKVVEEEGLRLDPTKVSIYLLLKRAEKLLDHDRFLRFKRRIYGIVRKYELIAARETLYVDGVLELISWLKDRGVKLALLTNNSIESVDIIDERLGVKRYFDVIVTRDDAEKIKPDPGGLLLALERLGTKEALMVGDSPSDVIASERAGIFSVGVASGSPYRELLIKAGPDFIVDKVGLTKEVVKYLQTLNRAEKGEL